MTVTLHNLTFSSANFGSTVYFATGIDVRNSEIPVLSIMSNIRSFDKKFNGKNIVLTVKHTKDWRYTVLLSTSRCSSAFGAMEVYEITENETLTLIRNQEDSDEKVYVDVLLAWDHGKIEQCLQYVDTSRWQITDRVLNIMEVFRSVGKFIGFTVLSNAVVASVSYWFTGTPWYLINAVLDKNSTITKSTNT